MMHKGLAIFGLIYTIQICGMDTKDTTPQLPLSLSHVQLKRPRCDRFGDLVEYNAARLYMLVATEQHTYCSQLRKAAETLQHAFHEMRRNNSSPDLEEVKLLKEHCDKDSSLFILLISQKNHLCNELIKDLNNNHSDNALRIESILQSNRYVANHYFKDQKSKYRMTLLHYVIRYLTNIEDCMKCVEKLLCAGANASAQDGLGNTPLHKTKNEKLMRLLLQFGAQPNKQNKLGYTPLISHIRRNNDPAAIYLIESHVNLDIQDGTGETALHHAATKFNTNIISLLLKHGANFTLPNNEGQRPFTMNSIPAYKKIVEPYVQRALCCALTTNDSTTVQTLVKDYSWISFMAGEESIMKWAQRVCIKDSKLLQSVHDFEKSLSTLLFSAKSHEIVNLVAAGARVNQPSSSGMPPLMWAVKMRDRKKITVLLQKGAHVTKAILDDTAAQAQEIYEELAEAYDVQSRELPVTGMYR